MDKDDLVNESGDKKFRLLVEQAGDAFFILDYSGMILDVNRQASKSLGYAREELIGMTIGEVDIEVETKKHKLRYWESLSPEQYITFEGTHQRKDGSTFPVEVRLGRLDVGRERYLLALCRDITQRKKAEQDLKQSLAEIRSLKELVEEENVLLREASIKYRIVANNTYNWEFWLSPEGQFIYTSPSCKRISGHDAEEFNAGPGLIWSIIHPDDRQLWADHRHDIGQTKVQGEIEFRIVRTDGETRWIHHVCLPVFGDDGNYLGTRGSFSDITNRKLAEEKNQRLAAIVESSDDAIVGKTIDGMITSWNRGAERIFDYKESEVLGKPITILVPPEHVDELRQIHERIRRGEHIEHFETVRRRKDGAVICMSLTYSPIKDAQGRVVAVSTIGRDITEQKKAAAVLLDSARINRELEIAKEIQQSFLPTCPSALPGMLMSCCCHPAAHVGGDYYDFFSLEDGMVDAVIADVTGHSIGSSLLMTMTRSVLHAKVSSSRSPATLLATVNNLLYDDLSRAELLISMFYIRLDTENHTLAYANAGHNPPFLFRAWEGAFVKLDADGLLMGVKKDVCFEEKSILVEPGDILILYTDGITEAEDKEGNMFGTERLCRAIVNHCESHPKDIMSAIFHDLSVFVGPRLQSDDVAMIIFKIV